MPDFSHETRLLACHTGPIAGVDEAGRGPWAGPVVAAAVIFAPHRIPPGLDDSKKLSAKTRELLFDVILDQAAATAIGAASVDEIDRLNIRQATHLAMARAIASLKIPPGFALVDGNDAPALACACATLVKGDGLSVSIAAASILAKVTRDRMMVALHADHPLYGWDRNKGYGTKIHQDALKRYGCTAHHRRSFAPIHNILCGWNPGDSTESL